MVGRNREERKRVQVSNDLMGAWTYYKEIKRLTEEKSPYLLRIRTELCSKVKFVVNGSPM